MSFILHPSSFILCLLAGLPLSAQESAFRVSPAAGEVLDTHCSSCHGEDSQKGDLRFDQLEGMSLRERLDLLNRMQEQAFLGHMPPKTRKSQPTPAERKTLVDWISAELKVHHASTLEDKMRLPAYGNYVDHDKLFSGEIKDAPFTPARRWLVSPQIFEERVLDGFQLEGEERDQLRRAGFHGVASRLSKVRKLLVFADSRLSELPKLASVELITTYETLSRILEG